MTLNNTSKPKLIYLDDEELNLLMFREMFRKDFDIYTTTSATEALAYIQEHGVDLVVTDQLMPAMTGVEFLKLLVESIEVPPKRVMVSGYTQEGEVTMALESNLLDTFVKKPWTYDGLKSILLETIN
ncbi:MAG: response regulator [bacterium]|nr:response regulator [bacterium]